MNKTSLILSICALAVAVASFFVNPFASKSEEPAAEVSGQTASSDIAYFNMDQVLSSYQMAIDLQASFEKKAQGINDDLTRRNNKLESEQRELADKLNKGLVTRSTAEVQYNKWQEKVNSFQQLTQQKNNELAEEQSVMLNNIADAVASYVKSYNEAKGYAAIFSTSGSLLTQPVVAADAALDITQAIIDGLNAEYASKKSK